ncbi:MAG: oxidoreductase domain-containing protein [Piptocephalis tieghemiana]|nr:MAG: oxidoreductase domain-containing protein [Piptocephalis tieghemiana]
MPQESDHPVQLNVAIIGFGMSARVFHAPLIQSSKHLALTTILQRSSSSAKEVYPDVQVVHSAEELWAKKDVDLVIITTPNSSHYELATGALKSGKDVVVEKPFTVTPKEAEDLTALAKSTGRLLSVYHNRRWDGDFLTIQKLLKDGILGRIVDYESHYDRYRPKPKPGNPWRERGDVPGSGIMYDLGAHLIDQALTLFGPADSITADLTNQRQLPGHNVDDSFDLRLNYTSGIRVILRAGMLVRETGPRFMVFGTKGSFIKSGFDPQESKLKEGYKPGDPGFGEDEESAHGSLKGDVAGLGVDARIQTVPGSYITFYRAVAQAALRLRGKDEDAISEEERATRVIRYIEAAVQSSKEGRTISLKGQ